jgi:hypothetical protein
MLYIKFNISDREKFSAFKAVYNHMCNVREPNYREKDREIDWETASEEEIDRFMDQDWPKIELFNTLFPAYTNQVLNSYFYSDNSKNVVVNEDKASLINYLEYGFEVDLDALQELQNNEGIIKISTGNYPFGGLDRFLMTLKSFGLMPFECFDGFDVIKYNWISEIEYEEMILIDKTKEYLSK